MTNILADKVVVITGASAGIGAATARMLAAEGCRLSLAARSVDRLEALAAELGGDHLVVPTDITSPQQVTAMVQRTLEHFGRIDVLFANAGIYIPGDVIDGDPDAWSHLLAVNIDGVLRSVHAVLPHMKGQQAGDILVTTSIAGFVDIPWEPIYSASKHAVQSFVHTLRRQVLADGIRVGSIAPGMVANELWGFTEEEKIDEIVAARGAIRSEDVAAGVVYILSQPRHVTIRDLVMLPQGQDI